MLQVWLWGYFWKHGSTLTINSWGRWLESKQKRVSLNHLKIIAKHFIDYWPTLIIWKSLQEHSYEARLWQSSTFQSRFDSMAAKQGVTNIDTRQELAELVSLFKFEMLKCWRNAKSPRLSKIQLGMKAHIEETISQVQMYLFSYRLGFVMIPEKDLFGNSWTKS